MSYLGLQPVIQNIKDLVHDLQSTAYCCDCQTGKEALVETLCSVLQCNEKDLISSVCKLMSQVEDSKSKELRLEDFYALERAKSKLEHQNLHLKEALDQMVLKLKKTREKDEELRRFADLNSSLKNRVHVLESQVGCRHRCKHHRFWE